MKNDRAARSRSDGLNAFALFERRPTEDSASDVEVVVKRKRTLQAGDGSGSTVEGRSLAEEATVRAPRVFRVDAPVQPAVEPVKDLPTEPRPRMRRRRVRHGEVKIIRPAATDSTDSSSKPVEHGSETQQSSHLVFPDFGVGPREKSRYTALMTQIARLKLQAEAAKKAVGWFGGRKMRGECGA